MNISQALSKLDREKRLFFRWKFNIPHPHTDVTQLDEENLLKRLNAKTFYQFDQWMKTDEYKNLVALYLQSRSANDLLDVYNAVLDKAKKGDARAVDVFIKLQKEIKQISKNNNDDEDDLII